MKVLLSIKPEFVEKIFNGEKKYEYRKAIFKKEDVDTIVVYSTMPEGRIVGEFKIDSILVADPEMIWKQTKEHSGISSDFFHEYFADRVEGYAIKITEAFRYDHPIDPKNLNQNFHAPQSFRYIYDNLDSL